MILYVNVKADLVFCKKKKKKKKAEMLRIQLSLITVL